MEEEACVKGIQLFKCPKNKQSDHKDGTQGLMLFKIYETNYSGEPGTISERIEERIVPEFVGVNFDESLIRSFYIEPPSLEDDVVLKVVKGTKVFEDDTAEGLVQEIFIHMQCCYRFRDNMYWSDIENECSLVIVVDVARVLATMDYRKAKQKLREARMKEAEDGMDQESYDDDDDDDDDDGEKEDDGYIMSLEEDEIKGHCLVNYSDHGDDDDNDVIHEDDISRVSESFPMHIDDDNNQDMVHEDDVNRVNNEEFTLIHDMDDDDYDSDHSEDDYIESLIDDELKKRNDHVDFVKKWNGVPLDDNSPFELVEVKPLPKIEKMEWEMIRYGVSKPIFEDNTLKHADCSICFEGFSNVIIETRKFTLLENPNAYLIVRLSCGHVFHQRCIIEWILKKSSCPLCRSSTAVYVPGV